MGDLAKLTIWDDPAIRGALSNPASSTVGMSGAEVSRVQIRRNRPPANAPIIKAANIKGE